MEENQSILSLIREFKIPLSLAIISISFISAGIYYSINNTSSSNVSIIEEESSNASNSATIVVHIAGAVNKPGLYTFPSQIRIGEVIKSAGGLSTDADRAFVEKKINFAQVVLDGTKIYIPFIEEEAGSDDFNADLVSTGQGININSASNESLMELNGIGEVRAQKIIDNRPYTNINELLDKKIIPTNVFEDIKDKIML